jgi:hypothetical protein
VLSVWDKDMLFTDDLVGCAELNVCDMAECTEEEKWYPLRNAQLSSKVCDSLLCVRTTLTPRQDRVIVAGDGDAQQGECLLSQRGIRANHWFSACPEMNPTRVEATGPDDGQEVEPVEPGPSLARIIQED